MSTETFSSIVEVDLENTDNDIDFETFGAAYDSYVAECSAALRLTLARIENLCESIERQGIRNPFDRIESRIKTFKSVKGKCFKKGYSFDTEGLHRIGDIAGIRIITKYIDEIDMVKELISKTPGINIVKEKDYVKNPKTNGYQSLHLDCQVEIHDPFTGSKLIPVEIQVRSKSMNLWATLEHDLKYKNPNPSPEVEEKFRNIGKILRAFDEEAIALRDYNEVVVENNESTNIDSIATIVAQTIS
ncbi:hypothetical protein IJ076_00540 [Candidatus Saccharibacteria bacterium]|nr:hypothetical protein [Candidatus Saccharibacteria bacterium]